MIAFFIPHKTAEKHLVYYIINTFNALHLQHY